LPAARPGGSASFVLCPCAKKPPGPRILSCSPPGHPHSLIGQLWGRPPPLLARAGPGEETRSNPPWATRGRTAAPRSHQVVTSRTHLRPLLVALRIIYRPPGRRLRNPAGPRPSSSIVEHGEHGDLSDPIAGAVPVICPSSRATAPSYCGHVQIASDHIPVPQLPPSQRGGRPRLPVSPAPSPPTSIRGSTPSSAAGPLREDVMVVRRMITAIGSVIAALLLRGSEDGPIRGDRPSFGRNEKVPP